MFVSKKYFWKSSKFLFFLFEVRTFPICHLSARISHVTNYPHAKFKLWGPLTKISSSCASFCVGVMCHGGDTKWNQGGSDERDDDE